MKVYDLLRLVGCALVPALVAVFLYYIIKRWNWFKKLNYWVQQLLIGLLFSLFTLLAFYLGVDYSSIDTNNLYKEVVGNFSSANAIPIISGLIFGGPSGLFAGSAACIYRLFIYPFNSTDYLRGAECISVFLAGGVAWLLRITLFDNKKPKWYYGLIAGILIEDIHVLLIFAFGLIQVNATYAYGIIKACDIACIVTASVTIMLALIGVALVERSSIGIKIKGDKRIATKIQRWFIFTFGVCLLVTTLLTYFGNVNKCESDINEDLLNNNSDIALQLDREKINEPAKEDLTFEKITTTQCYPICRYKRINKDGFSLLITKDYGEMIVSCPSDIFGGENAILCNTFHTRDKKLVSSYQENVVHLITLSNLNGTFINDYYMMRKEFNGFHIVSFISKIEANVDKGIIIRVTEYLEILIFITIFGVIYVFIKLVVVSNIHKINRSLDLITNGNLNVKVDVRSNQEFSDLSDDINQTVDTLKLFIEEANKRIDNELKYAKKIQQNALPIIFPTTSNYDLYASMNTAKQVGGDFYDFFKVGNDKILFLIADVSGKGIPAAMFMMRAKTLIKSLIQTNEFSLEIVVDEVNEELNDDNEAGMFVTGWIGLLNVITGEVEFVNCGHCSPIIKDGDNVTYLKMIRNTVLGVMPGFRFKSEKFTLKENDSIILYTDGVTEATNVKKELYGEERLLELIKNSKAETSREILDIINKSVNDYQTGAEQADDITLLTIRYKPKK